MAYTRTNWATGDVVTAEKLNNIETRIDTGIAMVLHVAEDPQTLLPTLDATWQEIYDAVSSGVIVILVDELVTEVDIDGTTYNDITLSSSLVTDVTVTSNMDYDHVVTSYDVAAAASMYGTFTAYDPNERPANGEGPK